LIWFGISVAFDACCFFAGLPVAGCSAVPLGVAVSVGVADGVSDGSGVGDVLFFLWGEVVGDGLGDSFFFFELGDGDSGAGDAAFFFVGETDADGIGEVSLRAGEDFFDGVGVGDFLVVVAAVFFFRGFGVGVGVEKTFFSASPRDCSAGLAAWMGEKTNATKIRMRRSM